LGTARDVSDTATVNATSPYPKSRVRIVSNSDAMAAILTKRFNEIRERALVDCYLDKRKPTQEDEEFFPYR
jgi:hypothetical protein